MIKKVKDYFTYNRKERNGILLLSFVLFLVLLFYQFTHLFVSESTIDFSEFEKAVAEIWGLDRLDLDKLKNQTQIDTTRIRKININKIDINEFRKHPYVNYKEAKMIVNYRVQHGNFNEVKDIQRIKPISPEIFCKIAPYLITND